MTFPLPVRSRAYAVAQLVLSAGFALFLTVAMPARAATYDPDLKWRTLSTEHFDIHFHQGIEQVADELSAQVEDIYGEMEEELDWRLRQRVQVLLIDRTDGANGFATTIPYNAITIYVTAPTESSTLNLYEDWLETIFVHELTHVVHMETNHGIVRAARAVVGRIASTNDVSPRWIVEGLATYQETRHTAGGRGRATWPDMIKRTAVLEDAFPPLGNLDGFQPNPPSGNLRYLFGQDFVQYLVENRGEKIWTKWTHTYGSGIPFWLPTKKVFGKQLVPWYRDWRAHLHEHYGAQADAVRREGETHSRLVSDPDANCVAPAFSPDGTKLVWSCYDLKTGSAIWMGDNLGSAPEKVLQDFGAGYFTWRSDSKAFVYASTHIVNRFNVWSDIYMHTLGGGTTALTNGARARDPDFSPDGSRLIYVTNRAQNNQLQTMTVDRRQTTLTDNTRHVQFSTPRFAPSGEVVALSVWDAGQRDLWLYSPEGEPLRRLTMDTAIDADPVWSSDGRWLYFSSDRTGIPNIYAIEVATERLFQVTNVLTGAVKPSVHPTESRIAFMQYSQDGWDVRVMELDRDAWLDRGTLPQPLRYGARMADVVGHNAPEPTEVAWTSEDAPTSGNAAGDAAHDPFASDPLPFEPHQDPEILDNFGNTRIDDAFGSEQDYPFRTPPRRYNPLPTLLPRYVLPSIRTTAFRPRAPWDFTCLDEVLFCPALQVTLSSSATDALRRYGWSANVNYRTDANYLGAGGSFTINRFLPVFTVSASTRAIAASSLTFFDPEAPLGPDGQVEVFRTEPNTVYWERRSSVSATVSWPYRLRSTAFAQYSFSERRPRFTLPANTFLPNVPLVGTVGALSGGWRYSWSQPTALAISAEDARSFALVGSLLSPYLGTTVRDLETGQLQPLTQVQLTSELRQYTVMPWLPNHVLAGRAAAGVTLGGVDFLGNYQLGGAIGDANFSVVPDSLRMLRGYPLGFDIGDMYWLASLEYRLPLWYIHRGVGTIPIWMRNLSGAVFIDAGNAFNSPTVVTGRPATFQDLGEAAIEAPLVGVGAEISWRTAVAWGIGLTGRVGWAIGLTEGGVPSPGWRPALLRPIGRLVLAVIALFLGLLSGTSSATPIADAMALGDCETALDLLEGARHRGPYGRDANKLAQAWCLQRADDPEGVLDVLPRGSELSGYSALLAAKALMRLGRSDEALSVLAQADPPGQAGREARLLHGRILAAHGDARGFADLSGLFDTPLGPEARFWTAEAHGVGGDTDALVAGLQETWALAQPGGWDVRAAQRLAELGAAVPELSTPKGRTLAESRLAHLHKARRTDEALSLAEALYAGEAPADRQGWIELGRIYFAARAYPKALEAWQQAYGAPEEAAGSPEELFDYALCHARTDDYETAAVVYRRVIAAHPDSRQADFASFKLGYMKFDRGDCDAATALFEAHRQGYAGSRHLDEALWFESRCHWREGRVDVAVERLTALEQSRPQSSLVPGAAYWRARASNADETAALERILERWPNSGYAWFAATRLGRTFPPATGGRAADVSALVGQATRAAARLGPAERGSACVCARRAGDPRTPPRSRRSARIGVDAPCRRRLPRGPLAGVPICRARLETGRRRGATSLPAATGARHRGSPRGTVRIGPRRRLRRDVGRVRLAARRHLGRGRPRPHAADASGGWHAARRPLPGSVLQPRRSLSGPLQRGVGHHRVGSTRRVARGHVGAYVYARRDRELQRG